MAVNAVQWLCQRLAMLGLPRHRQPGLGAFTLPPEIILMIATHLANTSVISLALTCRTLYSLCFPEHPRLNMAENEELLLLLEKDVDTLYFCHYCAKLHRWYTSWANSRSPWVQEDLPCKQQLLDNVVRLPLTCYVPYHHARLFMNRHLYGPTHGPPLCKLEKRVRLHGGLYKVIDSESMHARIVDNNLLVLSAKTVFHPRGDTKALREHVDSLGHEVCSHLTLANGCRGYASVQLPELAKGKTTPGHLAPCDQSVRSCTFCLTDYCIDISWNGEKGYVIKVSVYRQLGNCRSPFDWSWHTMTTPQTRETLRKAFLPDHRPGSVRDRWNKADGIDSRTDGEWVELPEPTSLR